MGNKLIDRVRTKQLKVLPNERGLLMETMRCDDEFFEKFAQVYRLTLDDPSMPYNWALKER